MQARDLTGERIPSGRILGNVTQLNLSLSRAEHLTGTTGSRLTRAETEAPARYVVTNGGGDSFWADHVVVATGMGKQKFPFDDPETLKLIETESKNDLPRIEFLNRFMARNQVLARAEENPMPLYANQRIIVIGPGDGGAIATEYVLGHGPPEGYGFHVPAKSPADLPSVVHWFGQKAKTSDEYKQNTWERYWDLAPHFEDGRIQPYSGRARKIEKIETGPEAGAFKVYFGPGEEDFKIGDHIVVAAGYDNTRINEVLSGLEVNGARPEYRYVDGTLPESDAPVHLARGVSVQGEPVEGVYVVGPATGGLDTVGEAGGPNSPRIETLAKRTAVLAKKIESGITKPKSVPRGLYSQKTPISVEAKPQPQPAQLSITSKRARVRVASEQELEHQIHFRMLKALQGVNIPPGRSLSLSILPNSSRTRLTLKSSDVSVEELKKIRQALREESDLLPMILRQSKAKPNPRVYVLIKADSEGESTTVQIRFVNPKPANESRP